MAVAAAVIDLANQEMREFVSHCIGSPPLATVVQITSEGISPRWLASAMLPGSSISLDDAKLEVSSTR